MTRAPGLQATAKDVFQQKHSSGGEDKHRVLSDSFRFYRMNILQDIYFVGGFGTMQWIDIEDYTTAKPDSIVLYHPHETIEHLSDKFGDRLIGMFSPAGSGEEKGADASVISIDARGMDVRVRYRWECTMHRLPFDALVQTPAEAERAVDRALAEAM